MDNKNKTIIILSILTIIFTIMGGTLAYFNWQSSSEQNTAVTFTVGANFSCSADGGGSINNNTGTLAPAHCNNENYAFKRIVKVNVSKSGANNIYLDMYLNVDSIDPALANTENFRYALTTGSTSCDDGVVSQGNFKGAAQNSHMSLIKGKEYNTTTNNDTYYLWIWLDYPETNSETMNKNFSVSLGGTCTDNPDTLSCPIPQYDNTASTPSQPVLDTGMIPVKIADNGLVTAVAASDPTWYNYSNKEWANAVLVKEEGLRTRAENKVAGTNINQNDILAYYVWIPRYKYAIPEAMPCGCINNVNMTDYPACYELSEENRSKMIAFFINSWSLTEEEAIQEYNDMIEFGYAMDNIGYYNDDNDPDMSENDLIFQPNKVINHARQINIIFEDKNATKSNGTAINKSYYTHTAFTFGSQELDGFWVGKFEMSHDTLTTSTTYNNLGCTNTTCTNASGLRILPTVSSLRYNDISNMYYATRSMEQSNNVFGITNSDSHMMKNSEWGAVAYLSHSKYGINTEIRKNNYGGSSKPYLTSTGCGADAANANTTTQVTTCAIPYGTVSGETYAYPQSTTGNISGVFDMSGGAYEYVMGNFNGTIKNSGFSTMPDNKYYDNYPSSIFTGGNYTNMSFCTLATCGGHALNETRAWYSDYARFVDSGVPWFDRGGNASNSTVAGAFGSNYHSGYVSYYNSWRGVLVASGS